MGAVGVQDEGVVALVVGVGEPREQGGGGFAGFAHKAGVAAVFALRLDKLLDKGGIFAAHAA